MNTDELRASWVVTRSHLEIARNLLPVLDMDTDKAGNMEHYDEMLAANELELALDELAALGKTNTVPQPYWEALIAAASNMGLTQHVEALSLCSRAVDV